ncbi:MAG TPA: DUF6644 family protein [Magnetospirillaceae bacterium]|nr:DUF6644 family protein [Magnetospirillaceae bacterium]
MSTLIDLIQNSDLAVLIREDDYLFPIIESIHVLAILLVFGSIMVVDLRLMGLASAQRPVTRLTASILPLTWVAFVFAISAGGLMFISKADKYWSNGFFETKMVLIAGAGLNMAIFHLVTGRDQAAWDLQSKPPLAARLAGGTSLLLWISIVACGRGIGFTMPVE